MIGLILFGAGFALGMLAGQDKLIPWVRGAAGKARDVVLGSRPARTLTEVSPPLANKTIHPLEVLTNVGRFIWHWRNWIIAGLIALVAWGVIAPVVSFVTCPFGLGPFCASKSDNAAIESERTNTRVAEHETDVARVGANSAERTLHDAARRERVIAEAQQELTDAVSQSDLDRIHSAYERAHGELWRGYGASDQPDQSAPGSDAVRRPAGHTA